MKKENEIVIYKDEQKGIVVEADIKRETIWLTQQQVAKIFDVQKTAISKHVKNIFSSAELEEKATVSILEIVQKEGQRSIKRWVEYYSLDLILSIGYRVNSKRATQFRIWTTKVLKNHREIPRFVWFMRFIKVKLFLCILSCTIKVIKNEKIKRELNYIFRVCAIYINLTCFLSFPPNFAFSTSTRIQNLLNTSDPHRFCFCPISSTIRTYDHTRYYSQNQPFPLLVQTQTLRLGLDTSALARLGNTPAISRPLDRQRVSH